MIDTIFTVANVSAFLGNAAILALALRGLARFGRKGFLVCFALSAPILILSSVANFLSCLVGTTAGKAVALCSLGATALYPVAVALNVAGLVLLLKYVDTTESEHHPGA